MSGGGSQTTTSSSTVPPQFLDAYQNTVNRATSVAKTPYQSYGGNLVAGFSGDQTQAQADVRNAQGTAQPYLGAAENSINRSTAPLWAQTMQSGVPASSGVAGYTPNFWGSTAQSGVAPGSGVAGYTPDYWGKTMQSGANPSSGIAGYSHDFYGNAPGVNASTIAQYENPYQSQVINATEGQIANTDAQQFNQLGGNAASSGAFGGDRMGVAQGILGGQQAVANNSTLAGLNQANYSQALGEANQQQGTAIAADEANQTQANAEFNQQQGTQLGAMESAQQTGNQQFDEQQQAQLGANEAATQVGNSEFNTQQAAQLGANEANSWLNSQAGYANASLGNEANGLALTDASALSQSGLTQQQQQQAGLNTAYEQWQAQQAFPYQQTGWLANITEGIGSNVGGSSTSTTSSNAAGGRIGRAGGGIVPAHYDGGGSILDEVPNVGTSYIPTAGVGGSGGVMGRGPPPAQSQPMQPGMFSNPATDIGAMSGATSLYKNLGLGGMFGGSGAGAVGAGTEYAGAAAGTAPLTAVASAPLGAATAGAGAAGSAAGGAGFLGSLGSAVEAGAAEVGTAASAVGSGLAAGASAIGDGLAAGGSWLMSLLPALFALKDGGAVNAPKAHADYQGGIVLPFPQDRVRRAGGGIVGNSMPMPYTQAPPMPMAMQATGTTGMPPINAGAFTPSTAGQAVAGMGIGAGMFERGGPIETRAFGGGVGGHGTGGDMSINPFSMGASGDMHSTSPAPNAFGMGPAGSGGIMGPRPFGLRTGGIVAQRFDTRETTGQKWGTPIEQTAAATGAGVRLPPTTAAMNRGGIVRHFDTGGATSNDNGSWSGAGDDSSDSAWDAPASAIAASTSSGSSASSAWPSDDSATASPPGGIMGNSSSGAAPGGFTPDKPNLWLPAAAAVASAIVGKHSNAGRNIAEGVLSGLGAYSQENSQYQAGREKAASLDQEAKKLADDADFHRAEIARQQQATDQLGKFQSETIVNDKVRTQAEIDHNNGMLGIDNARLGIDGQRVTNENNYQTGELAIRQQMADRRKFAMIGTDPSGNPIFQDSYSGNMQTGDGNTYTGKVSLTPAQQAIADAKSAQLSQSDRHFSDSFAQKNGESARKVADAIYYGSRDVMGKPSITYEQAAEQALQQMPRFGSPRTATPAPTQSGQAPAGAPQASAPFAPTTPAGLPSGSRLAPDGNWYAPNPNGGWMKATQGGS